MLWTLPGTQKKSLGHGSHTYATDSFLDGIRATTPLVGSHSNLNRELTLHKPMNAGEGIRTRELLREQILSLPPLTAWLPPHNYRKGKESFRSNII